MSRLSQATGLKRASLYHRFPGGKSDMVRAAFDQVNKLFEDEVLAPCHRDGDPKARAQDSAKALERIYEGGRLWCLLEVMSLEEAEPWARERASASFAAWRSAFERLASDAHIPDPLIRAEDAIALIQGSLVVSRLAGSGRSFLRTLKQLPSLLTDSP